MTHKTILGMIFVVFCGAVGYQLATDPRPTTTQQVQPTPSAYGPALVAEPEFEDNEGEYGLIEPEDECHAEEVCSSWAGCLDACSILDGDEECYADCAVDENLELDVCESEGVCYCDTFRQFCSTFCRADG